MIAKQKQRIRDIRLIKLKAKKTRAQAENASKQDEKILLRMSVNGAMPRLKIELKQAKEEVLATRHRLAKFRQKFGPKFKTPKVLIFALKKAQMAEKAARTAIEKLGNKKNSPAAKKNKQKEVASKKLFKTETQQLKAVQKDQ